MCIHHLLQQLLTICKLLFLHLLLGCPDYNNFLLSVYFIFFTVICVFFHFSYMFFFLKPLYFIRYAQFMSNFFVFSAIFPTKKVHESLQILPCTFKNYPFSILFTLLFFHMFYIWNFQCNHRPDSLCTVTQ